MNATPRTAIVGYTAEPYRTIAATLQENLKASQPELVLLDPHSMTAAKMEPVLCKLNNYPIVVVHVRVLLWGTNYVRARNNLLHFLNQLNGKVILVLDEMLLETFSWHVHIKRMLALGLRPRLRERLTTAVEFRNSLMAKQIWRAIARDVNKGKAFVIGCNDLKLTFWQRVNEIKDTQAAYLQVLAPQQIAEARASETKTAIRNKYGFGEKDIVIAAIGNITTTSGLKALARAMAYLPVHYKLVICGAMKLPPVPSTTHGDAYIDIINHYIANMKTGGPTPESAMLPNKWLGLKNLLSNINRLCRLYGIHELSWNRLVEFGDRADFLGQLLDEIKLAVPDAVSHKRVFFIKSQNIQRQANLAAAANVCIFADSEMGLVTDPLVTLASEVQDQLYLSYNQLHREFIKLQPGRALYFDVGNDLELAEKLRWLDQDYDHEPYKDKATWAPSLAEACQKLINAINK